VNKKTLKQLVHENKNLILKDKRTIDNIYKKIEDRIMQNKK